MGALLVLTGLMTVYLHGFADVHSVKESWMPFHEQLAKGAQVIAPAHPGCAQSDENKDLTWTKSSVLPAMYVALAGSTETQQFH